MPRVVFTENLRRHVACDPADVAAKGAAFGGFIGAGQTCIAGTRILVQRGLHDDFVHALVAQAEAIRIGDDVFAPSGGEVAIGDIDGDALLAFGAQATSNTHATWSPQPRPRISRSS